MPVCFHVGCRSGHRDAGPVHLFTCPKDPELQAKWFKNIPKQKTSTFEFEKSVLCEKHFEDEYIVKESVVVLNGVVIASAPRRHWALTNDAVPTIFANSKVPSYFNKKVKKRKALKLREPLPEKKRKIPSEPLPINNSNTSSDNSAVPSEANVDNDSDLGDDASNSSSNEQDLSARELKQTLLTNMDEIKLPTNNWIVKISDKEEEPLLTIFEFGRTNLVSTHSHQNWIPLEFIRIVEIDHEFNVRVHVKGKELPFQQVSSLNDINNLLAKVAITNICKGIKGYGDVESCKLGINNGSGIWFSKSCDIICETELCVSCKKFKPNLVVRRCRKKQFNNEPASPPKSPVYYRKKLAKVKHRLREVRLQIAKDRIIIKNMNKRFRETTEANLIASIDNCPGMADNSKSALKEAVKLAQQNLRGANGKHGVRYAPDWLLQCLLLKITSSKAYRYLRDNKTLPLPHKSSLHRLIRGLPCSFGFSDSVLRLLKKELESKDVKFRHGVLLFDEMKVNQAIDFNKNSMKFKGFVDFDTATDDYYSIRSDKTPQLADHALVLMFRPFNGSWFKGREAKFAHYRILYNEDKKNHLRAAFKLTETHLNPGPFQKMVVSFATQLFSKSVADALQFYKSLNVKGLDDADGTIELTASLNGLFDALNSRHPKEGLTLNSTHYELIKKFSEMLNDPKVENTFGSPVTMSGLRVTLKSVLELAHYLIEDVGYLYLLTAKLNQDCLEKFFGLIRSFGGDNDHPSITSFSYLYRLLSLYHPLSNITKSNISSGEKCSVSLTTYSASLRETRQEVEESNRKLRDEIKNKISQAIVVCVPEPIQCSNNDHDYSSPRSTDCQIYQICGFLAFRAPKFTNCFMSKVFMFTHGG